MTKTLQSKAMIIILSAPSGGGKSSIAKKLLELGNNLSLSISATTRTPRTGEKEAVHYFFKNKNDFQQMVSSGQFLEFAEIYGNLYGTPKEYVKNMLTNGIDVLFDIDYQGAYQIRQKMPGKILSIFIKPPSIEILRARVESRGQDTKEIIDKRIMLAQEEMSHAENYDYVVINDNFDKTVLEIQNIINREHLKNEKK